MTLKEGGGEGVGGREAV